MRAFSGPLRCPRGRPLAGRDVPQTGDAGRCRRAGCGGLALLLLCACGKTAAGPGDSGVDGGLQSDGGTGDGGSGDGGTGTRPPEVKVKAIFPGSGASSGGGTAMVTGSGFVEGFALRGGGEVSKLTTVRIGGAAGTNVDVIDDNRLELTLPAGAPGAADVSVTNPNGTGTCTGCFRYVAPVKVTSLEPGSGPTAGGTAVTVHGDGFTGDLLLTIAGRELISLQIKDAQTATGVTPQGAQGGADVLAITRDGRGELRRGFIYADPVRVDAVTPPAVPTAGGTRIVVSGAGFGPLAQVKIDGAGAVSAWVDDAHLDLYAPAHAAGAVDVSVDGATLMRGLTYADPGPLALYAVQPARGPVTGGILVHVLGSGLSGAEVRIGGSLATPHPVSDVQLDVDLPPAPAPGLVDVEVRAAGASQVLAGAFRYDPALSISAIAPAEGPAAGGTAVTLTGAGLDSVTELRIGALDATSLQSALSAVTPVGSPGPADVVALTADGREARLANGFTFTAPLSISQVSPALGAQAGGTRIALYGRGFGPGLSAGIDGKPVTALQVVSPTQATALTPAGTPGAKPVRVARVAAADTLASAFTYFDPSSDLGGGSGGPLLGVLNVTVLEYSAFKDGGVQGATVQVVLPDAAVLTALTDANGQVTFSDPRLVLPVQVTAMKASYDAVTIAGVTTANLTVGLYGPPGPPPPPPDPPPPPPPPLQPASVAGHVYGFKLAPGTVLSATQSAVARVAIARSGIYSLPPFASAVVPQTVRSDGGGFSYDMLYSLSPMTLYAVFGIEDSATKPSTFEPLLLGVRRGVQPDPKKPVTDADIILDTHLDQSLEVTVLDLPSASGGHDAFVDLDLGQSGAIPFDRALQNSDPYHLRFNHLPRSAGQGFVFVDQYGRWTGSGIATPVTIYLRRVFGDLSGGVTLGPLLPFPVVQPVANGVFSWTLAPSALQPNLQQLSVNDSNGTQDTSWGVLLPGPARSIAMPDVLRARLAKGVHGFSIVTSVAPSFDFAHWNYADLYSGSWTAYSYADGSFTVP